MFPSISLLLPPCFVVWQVVDDAKVSFLWLLFKRDSNCISILRSITLMTGKLLPKYCDPIWTLTEARRKQECCEKDICRTICKLDNELVFIYLRYGKCLSFDQWIYTRQINLKLFQCTIATTAVILLSNCLSHDGHHR